MISNWFVCRIIRQCKFGLISLCPYCSSLTHWPLGDLDAILKLQFSVFFYWLVSSHLLLIYDKSTLVQVMAWCQLSSKDNALRWMPRDLTDDKSTLVQVMAWCRQATSHYLSQCWPRSMSPYGVIRPQWVNASFPGRYGSNFKYVILQVIGIIYWNNWDNILK